MKIHILSLVIRVSRQDLKNVQFFYEVQKIGNDSHWFLKYTLDKYVCRHIVNYLSLHCRSLGGKRDFFLNPTSQNWKPVVLHLFKSKLNWTSSINIERHQYNIFKTQSWPLCYNCNISHWSESKKSFSWVVI